MEMKSVAFIALLIVFVGGCGTGRAGGANAELDPTRRDPTEENFLAAIQDYFRTERACIELDIDFPAEFSATNRQAFRSRSRYLDELVAIGLLAVADTQQRVQVVPLGGSRQTKLVPSRTYSLTSMGRSVSTIWITELGETGTKLCYGTYRVVEIMAFTEPLRPVGVRIPAESQRIVTYTFEAADIAEWASGSQQLRSEFDVIDRDLAAESGPIEGTARLVLTQEGWVHRSLLTGVWGSYLARL